MLRRPVCVCVCFCANRNTHVQHCQKVLSSAFHPKQLRVGAVSDASACQRTGIRPQRVSLIVRGTDRELDVNVARIEWRHHRHLFFAELGGAARILQGEREREIGAAESSWQFCPAFTTASWHWSSKPMLVVTVTAWVCGDGYCRFIFRRRFWLWIWVGSSVSVQNWW